jgi:hypothetical protein
VLHDTYEYNRLGERRQLSVADAKLLMVKLEWTASAESD